MRKRQWKKILSVVLTLAMVFSMNITAFADEVTDPVPAVEEPAAEEPVAEAPVESNEETPKEETKEEEPAAPAEEPAAEEPAPVEPAEEAAPEKGEEAAGSAIGGLVGGWTTDIDETKATSENDLLTITDDPSGGAITGTAATATMRVKATGAGEGKSVALTDCVAVADDVVTEGPLTLVAGKTYTLYKYTTTSGTAGDEVITFEEANAAGKITVSADYVAYLASNGSKVASGELEKSTAYYFQKGYEIVQKSTNNWYSEDLPGVAKLSVNEAGVKIDHVGNAGTKFYLSKESTSPNRATEATGDLDGSGDLAGYYPEDGDGDYYAWVRKAGDGSATFDSDWVPTTPKKVTVNVGSIAGTVSGMTFTPEAKSTWSKGEPGAGGIYTVKILTGTVTMAPSGVLGDVKSLSVDVAEGATLIADSAINGAVHVSLQGKGTVIFKAPSSYEGVAADVQLSGNTANKALVAKTTAANGDVDYYIVEKDVDAAAKAKAGALAIVSTTATNTTNTAIDFDGEEIAANFVLSENKKVWNEVTAYASHKLKVSDSAIPGVSVKFNSGKLLIGDAATPSTYTFVVVPGRAANEYPAGLVDGQQTATGVNVNRGTSKQRQLNGSYEFIISANRAVSQKDSLGWTWQTTGYDNINTLANGGALESDKTYYLYARRKPDVNSDGLFRSELKPVGSFSILKATSISINKAAGRAVSPNYIGDATTLDDDKELAFYKSQNTNALNASFFSWTFNYPSAKEVPGIHVTENTEDYTAGNELNAYKDDRLAVVDGDGFRIGTLTLEAYPAFTPGTNSFDWGSPETSLGSLTPGEYAVKASFATAGSAGAKYGNMNFPASNWISFNVIPAPVKVEPVVVTPQMSGNVATPTKKVTNQITGADATLTGTEIMLADGKEVADWNALAAGSYKITVSQGSLVDGNYYADKTKSDYSTEQTLTIVDKGGLGVVAEFKDDAEPVYYGTTVAHVKNQIEGYFTLGGTKTGDKQAADNDRLFLYKTTSDNLAAATALTDETIKTISANETIYAYYFDDTYHGQKVSSNALPITIAKRPVKLTYTGEALATVRGESLLDHVSTNLVKGTAVGTDYNITAAPFANDIKGTDLLGSTYSIDVPLDTSMISKFSAATKKAYINIDDSSLSTNFARNYTLSDRQVEYKVIGRYYIKYVLEYGGKKYVSSNVVEEKDLVTIAGNKKIALKPSTYKSVSWGNADGKDAGVLGKDNKITQWKAQRVKEGDKKFTNATQFNFDDTSNVDPGDYIVYAIVTAVATKRGDNSSVMVESITPVEYDGASHVVEDEGYKGNKENNLDLVLYDQLEIIDVDGNDGYMTDSTNPYYNEWQKIAAKVDGVILDKNSGSKEVDIYRHNLEYKKDYTVSYKNNKNASVAYDPTVSGDSSESGKNGADATFKQLFPENKRPQIIVKGKGDYAKMKVTVLFDILPTDVDNTNWDAVPDFFAPNKTLKVTPKPYENIYSNYEKWKKGDEKGWKKYTLKEGKFNSKKAAYTKDFVKEIYKLTLSSDGVSVVKKDLVTNFKKIPAGDYQVVIKGVNNYMGTYTKTIHVATTYLLSKQTFKWTKSKKWNKTPYTVADFKVTVKDKKTKKPIEILSRTDAIANEKPGIYVQGILKKTGKEYKYVSDLYNEDFDAAIAAGGLDKFKFKDAGIYRIVFEANGKLQDTNQIMGKHYIQIEVKGTKVKASDFKINNGKKLVYTGKPTAITVSIKNKKLKPDEVSKIPLGNTAKKVNVAEGDNEQAAIDAYKDKFRYDNCDSGYQTRDRDNYTDDGATYNADLVRSNVYSVGYVPANTELDKTYHVFIRPSGQFWADDTRGEIKLSYKYDVINLKNASKKDSAVKFIANDVQANIGGTTADLYMAVSGNAFEDPLATVSKDGFVYHPITKVDGKKDKIEIRSNYFDYDLNRIVYKFNVTYKNNKKTGSAKAIVTPADKNTKAYFKKSFTVPFNIVDRKVEEIAIYDADAMVPDAVVADITDAVEPKGNKSAKPVVTLYQVDETGEKVTKLKNKVDYTWAIGKTVSGEGIHIDVTAPSKGSFTFVDSKDHKTVVNKLDAGFFNVYGAKSKIKATLSDAGYDISKKGYTYTGSSITPTITSITYGGVTYPFPAGISTSSNFVVKYKNNIKVGTATATITMKKNADPAVSANQAYPYGGSVTVKFKIVPQSNQNLILNK